MVGLHRSSRFASFAPGLFREAIPQTLASGCHPGELPEREECVRHYFPGMHRSALPGERC
jgi:hypothetical protein